MEIGNEFGNYSDKMQEIYNLIIESRNASGIKVSTKEKAEIVEDLRIAYSKMLEASSNNPMLLAKGFRSFEKGMGVSDGRNIEELTAIAVKEIIEQEQFDEQNKSVTKDVVTAGIFYGGIQAIENLKSNRSLGYASAILASLIVKNSLSSYNSTQLKNILATQSTNEDSLVTAFAIQQIAYIEGQFQGVADIEDGSGYKAELLRYMILLSQTEIEGKDKRLMELAEKYHFDIFSVNQDGTRTISPDKILELYNKDCRIADPGHVDQTIQEIYSDQRQLALDCMTPENMVENVEELIDETAKEDELAIVQRTIESDEQMISEEQLRELYSKSPDRYTDLLISMLEGNQKANYQYNAQEAERVEKLQRVVLGVARENSADKTVDEEKNKKLVRAIARDLVSQSRFEEVPLDICDDLARGDRDTIMQVLNELLMEKSQLRTGTSDVGLERVTDRLVKAIKKERERFLQPDAKDISKTASMVGKTAFNEISRDDR